MNDPNLDAAPVLHPVVSAAQDAVRRAAERDLTDSNNERCLRKAMKALQVAREAFTDSADELDLALGRDASPNPYSFKLSDSGGDDDLVPTLGTAFGRAQRPNAPETFASRIIREGLTLAPEFLAQGRIRVEAERARAVSALAFDIAEADKRGDAVTTDMLRNELARLTMIAPAPSEGETALAAVRGLGELPAVSRVPMQAYAGAAIGAVKDEGEGSDLVFTG